MITKDLNRVVCDNCSEYIDKLSMTNEAFNVKNSCNKCINYQNGHCIKNMFNVIKDVVNMN